MLADRPRLRALFVATGLGVVGVTLGAGLVFAAALVARVLGRSLSPAAGILLSLVLVQGVVFGGVAYVYRRFRGRTLASLVSWPSFRDVLVALAAYGLSLAGAFLGAVVVTLLGVEGGRNAAAEVGMETPSVLLVLVAASFLLIGPGEELLFRGVVQNRLRETFGPAVSVAVAAALFASIHVLALSGGLGARGVTVAVLLLPSVVFGAAYEYTDNLAVPAFVHGAYDATLFSVLYLVLRLSELGIAPTPA